MKVTQPSPTPGSAADIGPDADPVQVAKTIVLNSLNQTPRTRKQLADLLRKREVPAEISQQVLDRFEELRLIDDEQYAYDWVANRHRQRGLSKRALAGELRLRGVSDEFIELALAQLDDSDELTAARKLAQRKASATAGLPYPVRHRRTMGAVMRKGYSASIAAQAVREALGDDS